MIKYAKMEKCPEDVGLQSKRDVDIIVEDLWKEARELYILIDELISQINEFQYTSSIREEDAFDKASELLTKE